MQPLTTEASEELDSIEHVFGEGFLQECSLMMMPMMVRLRLLWQILERRTMPSGRRLMIHNSCLISPTVIRFCRNRLTAPGDGRQNPNWRRTDFIPLHAHTAGFSESLIYSWQGTACMFVHGIVPFHMDGDMPRDQVKRAEEIEAYREREGDFTEALLFGERLIPVADFLSMSIDQLTAFLRLIGG